MPNKTSVQKHRDYAESQIDEQAIADKFNAATAAQFAAQREQNRQNENKFYNQMYNTQQTAMDTIRKSNAAAVSTGASRGVQAANELSALLGLQQQSVEGATELAQANRQTSQEETAAMLNNILKAYQQATNEKQQLTQQGIESESVDVQADANAVQREQTEAQNKLQQEQLELQKQQAADDHLLAQETLRQNNPDKYGKPNKEAQENYFKDMSSKDFNTNMTNGAEAIQASIPESMISWHDFGAVDLGEKGVDKILKQYDNVAKVYQEYGLSTQHLKGLLHKAAQILQKDPPKTWYGTDTAAATNFIRNYIQNDFRQQYQEAYNTHHKTK